MHPNLRHLAAPFVVVLLAGCATELTDAGGHVQLLASADQAARCTQIKVISENQRTGPDKAGNAMRRALNEAAAAGSNAFYVVSSSVDWAEGASVVGNALHCQ
jgi:hypothetical protein